MRGEEGSREAERGNKWPDRQAAVDVLFPIISTFLSKRRIIEKIGSLEEAEGAEIDFQSHLSFAYLRDIDDDNNNVLENKYDDALEHKKQLEDKAKSLVALTTISATMMLGLGSTASSMFGGIVQLPARVILAAVMIFSAFYMVAAAISSISVFASLNKAYLVDDPGRSTGDDIRLAIMQNGYQNILRNNYLSLSFDCLKRSLGSLFVVFLAMVVSA